MSRNMYNVKAYRFVVMVMVLIASAIVTLKLVSHKHGHTSSQRRVDKHFFFELLQQFDLNPRSFVYKPILTNSSSKFDGAFDRTLLSIYLVERFSYSSFLQIGTSVEDVCRFLPESVVKIRACLNINFVEHIDSALIAGSKYDLIVVELSHVSDNLIQKALSILSPEGTLILTDTNSIPINDPGKQSVQGLNLFNSVFRLRRRSDLDIATLDLDGGLTLICSRRNSNLVSPTLLNAVKGLGTAPAAAANERDRDHEFPGLTWELVGQFQIKLLNVLTFEDLHAWLASTGNVDALTAFGGEKSIDAFKDSIVASQRCAQMLHSSESTNKALGCLQEAAAAGKLSLRGRWLLVLLAMHKERIVDAVSQTNELLALSPLWYRWFLIETATAASEVLFKGWGTNLTPIAQVDTISITPDQPPPGETTTSVHAAAPAAAAAGNEDKGAGSGGSGPIETGVGAGIGAVSGDSKATDLSDTPSVPPPLTAAERRDKRREKREQMRQKEAAVAAAAAAVAAVPNPVVDTVPNPVTKDLPLASDAGTDAALNQVVGDKVDQVDSRAGMVRGEGPGGLRKRKKGRMFKDNPE